MRIVRRARSPLAAVIAATVLAVVAASAAVPAAPAAAATRAQWVIDENAKPGTSAWQIAAGTPKGISGYADRISAIAGDAVGLYVSTKARTFHVEAYRLGYYQGLGGRLIWTSAELKGVRQAAPTVDAGTNTVRAPWSRSLQISIDSSWVQGTYVLKLVSSAGGEGYIPLVVRDDSSHAALVIQQQAATWEAYNRWGGYSLYKGPDGSYATRSRVVTFDRPFGGRGAAGLLNSLPFVVLVEKLGLDVTYWTDVDLQEHPGLLTNHAALVSLDHDEYWSSGMRDAAAAARGQGVNLAFFGANAVYRHIRYDSSPLGPDRDIICYKSAKEDPLYGVDNTEVTADWRLGPDPRPESDLLGAMYSVCNPARASLTVVDASNWVFAGTGLSDGGTIPGLVDMEYDRVFPDAPTPADIQILAHSPLTCHATSDAADMTYYTAKSNAGVFDASSQGYVKELRCGSPIDAATCDTRAVQIVTNVLNAFAAGPAGVAHPSATNTAQFGMTLQQPTSP
jgi:hypothetical protein